jgi:rhamnogalacturonan acetylesterase
VPPQRNALPCLATTSWPLAFILIGIASPQPRAADSLTNPPTLYLIGDSTVRNGTQGQKGWGEVIAPFFDSQRVRVVNRALGGCSSRTFLTEGLWAKVLADLKTNDFVLMQFGHNDGGEIATGNRPRASLKGNGDETQEVTVEMTGKQEVVHSYGWYLRQYIADTKARGAAPIVLSPVPRKIWRDGRIARASKDYGQWASEAAQGAGAAFVDLNEIVARRYEALGPEKVAALFVDERTHTNVEGAELNAECVVAALKGLKPSPLTGFLSKKGTAVANPAK